MKTMSVNTQNQTKKVNSREKTQQKVFSYVEQHHMLTAHDKVVVGVSGGADSVCLLFMLLELRKRLSLEIGVVHVNHGIRPEAGEDEDYVRELCQRQGISFYSFHEKVRDLARRQGISEEEAGRNVRYRAFLQVAEQMGAEKIAVAHNANDLSETMLFHLFRGSGVKGLSGIAPVREFTISELVGVSVFPAPVKRQIIRPILCLERAEVEAYLAERNIPYCVDSTNEKDDYTRNHIRHHVIPYVDSEIVSGCVGHMVQTAEILSETEDFLEEWTRQAQETCCKFRQQGGEYIAECIAGCVKEERFYSVEINVGKFRQLHGAIQKRLLYQIFSGMSPGRKDITYVHVQKVLGLFAEQGNRSIDLPYGIRARRSYDIVLVEQRQSANLPLEKGIFSGLETAQETDSCPGQNNVKCNFRENIMTNPDRVSGSVELPGIGALQWKVIPIQGRIGEIPQNQYTKWFDYDKIKESLTVRYRQTGDYLTIRGGEQGAIRKSVKDYMITEKIPRENRDFIPVLADGSHIVWLIGYRISEDYKLNENTKRILQVQLVGKSCEVNRTEDKNG